MNVWTELLGNMLIVSPIVAWFIAQLLKTIIHTIINGKFVAERMVGGGGMPSSHSATVCALAAAAFMQYGAGSYEFAMALVFAMVTMYDATGVRRETGRQGEVLNDLIEIFKKMGKDVGPDKALKELIGHTPFQVLIGGLLGTAVAVFMCSYFG